MGRWVFAVVMVVGAGVGAGAGAEEEAEAERGSGTGTGTGTGTRTGAGAGTFTGTGTGTAGVADRGIYADLDAAVAIELPVDLRAAEVSGVIDGRRRLMVVYRASPTGDVPLAVYPLGGPARLELGGRRLDLSPADRAVLAPLLTGGRVRELPVGAAPAPGDRDGDGIPDPLDVHRGALKTALAAAPYVGGYVRIAYPGGDVPRDQGVCTDVVVRAVRNAGLDLQREVQRDIAAAPRAYPMVRRPDPNIDHRRVKTLLPYFVRRWRAHGVRLDDPHDPLQAGDVVFMDTFANKPGPDHIGVVSHRRGPSGHPLIVNAWTDGFVTAEMDLLAGVPLTHRFRIPPPPRER